MVVFGESRTDQKRHFPNPNLIEHPPVISRCTGHSSKRFTIFPSVQGYCKLSYYSPGLPEDRKRGRCAPAQVIPAVFKYFGFT